MTAVSENDGLLSGLGQRVKLLRARRGMVRRVLAEAAGVSERHLANLESGTGNVSVLVLRQVAQALDCALAELLGDETTSSPDWLMIRKILHGRSPQELEQARLLLAAQFGPAGEPVQRGNRIALIGMRGAGKSTLGRQLAAAMDRPFVELGTEMTRLAGAAPAEIQALYGVSAYRRYERQALKETLQNFPSCIIATAGRLVADAATLELLLSQCFTIWLQAEPEELVSRVIAQGAMQASADRREALDDLRLILEGRAALYAKADLSFNTSGKSLEAVFAGLRAATSGALEPGSGAMF